MLLATDHDSSGDDIDRDCRERLGHVRVEVRRVALLPEQVEDYRMPRADRLGLTFGRTLVVDPVRAA